MLIFDQLPAALKAAAVNSALRLERVTADGGNWKHYRHG